MTLKDYFVQAGNKLGEQYYPKGNPRRGEFIRDVAVLQAEVSALLQGRLNLAIMKARDSNAPFTTLTKEIDKLWEDEGDEE